jgi:hypothetical protein
MTEVITRIYPQLQDLTTDPADVSFLLSLANDMRREKGDPTLSDLPTSTPQEPNMCIIANAFNYGCEVNPHYNPRDRHILFNSEEDRDAYLKVVGISKEELADWQEEAAGKFWFKHDVAAPLTDELNDIATDFDEGKRFIEYVTEEDASHDYLEGIADNNDLDYDDLMSEYR